jgi:hypothetical protein
MESKIVQEPVRRAGDPRNKGFAATLLEPRGTQVRSLRRSPLLRSTSRKNRTRTPRCTAGSHGVLPGWQLDRCARGRCRSAHRKMGLWSLPKARSETAGLQVAASAALAGNRVVRVAPATYQDLLIRLRSAAGRYQARRVSRPCDCGERTGIAFDRSQSVLAPVIAGAQTDFAPKQSRQRL